MLQILHFINEQYGNDDFYLKAKRHRNRRIRGKNRFPHLAAFFYSRLCRCCFFLLLCTWALMAELRRFRPMSTRATAALTARIPSALLHFVTARIDRSKGSREEAESPRNRRWDFGEVQRCGARSTVRSWSKGWIFPHIRDGKTGWHLASEWRILYWELIFSVILNLN